MNAMLSVVIVEYRRMDEVLMCVDVLKQHLSVPYEIIVSSNSCYEEQEKARIVKESENVHWLFNERNGGFAYAMNEGLKQAKGDFLVIMNSDCALNSDLDGMMDFMHRHPEVGAIAPQMRDAEGNIQDSARPYVSLPRFLARQFRRVLSQKTSLLISQMDYSVVQTVDWLIGAFIMVSRAAYESTKGLDDTFFMYAEDLDWCTRIRLRGRLLSKDHHNLQRDSSGAYKPPLCQDFRGKPLGLLEALWIFRGISCPATTFLHGCRMKVR